MEEKLANGYRYLKLMEKIPTTMTGFMEEGEESLFSAPTTIKTILGDEAFMVFCGAFQDNAAYGHTLLYYRKSEGQWFRWKLECQGLEQNQRWEKVSEPFKGIESAIGYLTRTLQLRKIVSDEDYENICNSSILPLSTVMTAGKYSGRKLGEVIDVDFNYALWAINNMDSIKSQLED